MKCRLAAGALAVVAVTFGGCGGSSGVPKETETAACQTLRQYWSVAGNEPMRVTNVAHPSLHVQLVETGRYGDNAALRSVARDALDGAVVPAGVGAQVTQYCDVVGVFLGKAFTNQR